MEGDSPKPRGFLRSAQSSPGHPTRKPCFDKALALHLLHQRHKAVGVESGTVELSTRHKSIADAVI